MVRKHVNHCSDAALFHSRYRYYEIHVIIFLELVALLANPGKAEQTSNKFTSAPGVELFRYRGLGAGL